MRVLPHTFEENISFEIRKSTNPNTHDYHLKLHKFALKTVRKRGRRQQWAR
jgi:hypothetical protein